MAKNAPHNQSSSTRDKAKAMREAQQKQEKRVRNIIIAVVSVVVVGVVGALVAVIISANNRDYSTAMSGAQSLESAPLEEGGPIVVSSLGVGTANPDVPNLDMYFSYTCHWCAYLETSVGERLVADAESGQYNLRFFPVNTAEMAFQGPATNASLIVAQQAPDQWVAFHTALSEFVNEAVNVNSDPSVVQDAAASSEKVKELAREAGVPQDVIDQFGDEANDYLQAANPAWSAREVTGREEGSLGTPELIFMDTVVPWGQGTPDAIYKQITDEMQSIANGK